MTLTSWLVRPNLETAEQWRPRWTYLLEHPPRIRLAILITDV